MSVNLIEMAQGLFSQNVVQQSADKLGESPAAITKALSAIVPTIFGGLIQKSSTPAGAAEVAEQASSESDSSILDNLSSFFGGDSSNLNTGVFSNIFGGLLSGKFDNISNSIGNFAGVKSNTAKSLMSMAAPAIMGLLGKYFKSENVQPSAVSSLLSSQKQHVQDALPAGLSLSALFSNRPEPVAPAQAPVLHAGAPVTAAAPHHTEEVVEEKKSGMGILMPLFILMLLGAAVLYLWKGCSSEGEHGAGHDVEMVEAADSDNLGVNMAVGTLDTLTGDFNYNMGAMITLGLPNGGGSMQVGANSTEAKLFAFLEGSQALDTAKGNWFEFTNVKFNTGKSTIKEESLQQLKNMVMISKAFPTAAFKIGGYTDNSGSEELNLNLSKSRAAAVAAKIKELGARDGSIVSSDGYGSEHPIADNGTDAGKAQNRRVAVNVKAK